jgi:hypothetical protein
MAGDAQNLQYTSESAFFGGNGAAYASTGAPGTPVPGPEVTAGPVVGTPVISMPFTSSQVAANMPTVPVTSGDTCSMSSDSPVPAAGDWTGVPQAFIEGTGAGEGAAGHAPHPDSQARRP